MSQRFSDLGRPIRLRPELKPYPWGDEAFIPALLGLAQTGAPIAEAWWGAHVAGPSVLDLQTHTTLLDAVRERPTTVLGHTVAATFGELPFLLKVLSAEEPLSIQVHPAANAARQGFEAEEAAGIARDATTRCYRDPRHKPELLIALTPFEALCGFRPPAAARVALRDAHELVAALPSLGDDHHALETWLRAYFAMDEGDRANALATWLERVGQRPDAQDPDADAFWILRAHERCSDGERPDAGLVFLALLERLRLLPGEAMFLPAGVPHGYLRGAGLEVMANSDNVLRAGLTHKHVEPDAVLDTVRFDSAVPPRRPGVPLARPGVRRYVVPTTEFGVEEHVLGAGEVLRHTAAGPELWLALPQEPGATLSVADCGKPITSGECLLLCDGVTLTGQASAALRMIRVHVPIAAPALPPFRGSLPAQLRFGTSGLRGLVSDMTDLEAYVNARGFLEVMLARGAAVPGARVMLGGDLRPSTHSPTRSIMRAVAKAVTDAGLRVEHCGRLPTPALLLRGLAVGCASVMVTGSHIPFDRNGLKFGTPTGEVLKSDEAEILAGVARVRSLEHERAPESSAFDDDGWFRPGAADDLPPEDTTAITAYARRYLDVFAPTALSGLRVAVYEHSAVGRNVLVSILEALGADVQRARASDTFVPIDTEALGPRGVRTLQDIAEESEGPLDAVVSTDGDSDRPLVASVDAGGRVHFISGDVLGAMAARAVQADAVAIPISGTDLVDRMFRRTNTPIVRTRIGSPWVIAALANLRGQRAVGWEANGGFLHAQPLHIHHAVLAPLPTRDAVLPIVLVLREAAAAKRRAPQDGLDTMRRALPSRHGASALLDNIDRKASAMLLRHFGLHDELRRATFVGISDGVELERRDEPVPQRRRGQAFPTQALKEHARRARRRLHTHLATPLDAGRIASIDVLDGIRVRFENGDVAHVRPSGNAPQLRIYALANTPERAQAIVTRCLGSDGVLRGLLDAARYGETTGAMLSNIELTRELLERGDGPAMVGIVCGSDPARRFWQSELEQAQQSFGARTVQAFHEDLPVNQAFGLLLLWERVRGLGVHERSGQGALVAFAFGSGTRASPLTEAECGQKPALRSYASVRRADGTRRVVSLVELALRTFAPVEAFLRRSGFSGLVVKWGDEVQIPTLDLRSADPSLAGADVVRFVSLQVMTEDTAANKDWIGVGPDGEVTAFIPRRPLSAMETLASRGLLGRRGDELVGGVNLGSIAISGALADVLLETFEADVHDASALRSERPDLDPQLFTALCIARIDDPDARARAWTRACEGTNAVATLARRMPDVLQRLRGALETFSARHGRAVRIRALDFGTQYWGDIGQHRNMFDFYAALTDPSEAGAIPRALAGIAEQPDADGNRIDETSVVGPGVRVRNSVLVDAHVLKGDIDQSVLLGTRCAQLHADRGFDVGSTLAQLHLAPRAGSYRVVTADPVDLAQGERMTSVFFAEGPLHFVVHEATDLRDAATNYDIAIGDNPMSFAEAHRRATAACPVQTRARQEEAARVTWDALAPPKLSSP